MELKTKLVIFIILILFFGTLFLALNSQSEDYIFHLARSKDLSACPEPFKEPYCQNYPVLGHILSSPFAGSVELLKSFNTFLVTIVAGLLLYFYTKKWVIVFLFATTSIWFNAILGTLPQTFVLLFFIVFYFEKNFLIRAVLVVLGALTHSLGAHLLLLYWFLDVAFKRFGFLITIPSFPGSINFRNMIATFISQTNPIVIIEGFRGIFLKKRFADAALIIASFFMALGVPKALWVAQIVLVLNCVEMEFDRIKLFFSAVWLVALVLPFFTPNDFSFHWQLFFFYAGFLFLVYTTKPRKSGNI